MFGHEVKRSIMRARYRPSCLREISSTSASGREDKNRNQSLVEKMRHRLREDSTSNYEKGWDDLWKENVTPWELNMPTPVLEAELRQAPILMDSFDAKKTYNVLVPGAGSGFDLITLASHFDRLEQAGHIRSSHIIGLDISLTSLKRAEQVLQDSGSVSAKSIVTLAHGDFFNCESWKSVHSSQSEQGEAAVQVFQEGTFDLIYDYVFFCALPPTLRTSWADAVASLLKPGTGRLLTLMFPILPDAEMEGPPYPVTVEEYQRVLEPRGVIMESKPYASKDTIRPRLGKELVCWWRREMNPRSSL